MEPAKPSPDDWPFLDEFPPEREAKQIERVNSVPFLKLLGAKLVAAKKDYVRMSVEFRPDLTQPAGILHGGVHASLIDTAVAQAIVTTIKPGFQMVTIHLDTKYFKPVNTGTVYADARIVRKGKRVVHGEVTVTHSGGDTIAHGWCVYAITRG